jgi:hypothetical protein
MRLESKLELEAAARPGQKAFTGAVYHALAMPGLEAFSSLARAAPHSGARMARRNSSVRLAVPGNLRAYPCGVQSTTSSGRS